MRTIMFVLLAMAALAMDTTAIAGPGPILCPQPPTQPDGPCEPPPKPAPTPEPDPEPLPPVDKEPDAPTPY